MRTKTRPLLKLLHILVDMDDTTCLLSKPWEQWIQENGDPDFKWTDVKSWYVDQYTNIGKNCYQFLEVPGVFLALEPLPGAIKTIEKLRSLGHRIQFCTSPPNENAKIEKIQWLKHHFPWVDETSDVVFSHNKQEVTGDILFDDRAKWLAEFPGTSIAMDTHYNKHFTSGFRVQNWKEFFDLITRIARYAA